MKEKPKRPLMRYHGGKWKLGKWIISHFPEAIYSTNWCYTEPYGGAGSVLLQKERSYSEVWNDLDGELNNLFHIIRTRLDELLHAVTWTPYSRSEFELSFKPSNDPLEQARRTLFRAATVHHSSGFNSSSRSGFRSNTTRSGSTPASDWESCPTGLQAAAGRFRRVVLESDSATAVMQRYDTPTTLHYLDPVYVQSTRNQRQVGNVYKFEMSDNDHRDMATVVHQLQGLVAISGYPSDLYDTELFPNWQRVSRAAYADGASPRTECLWLSPSLTAALDSQARDAKIAAQQAKAQQDAERYPLLQLA